MGQRETVTTGAEGNGRTPVPVLGIDALKADPLRGWLAGLGVHGETSAHSLATSNNTEIYERLSSGRVSEISFDNGGNSVDDLATVDDLASAGCAIAAYLRGDFTLAFRHAENVRPYDPASQVFATSTRVLAALAVGDPKAAGEHLQAATNPFPLIATALISLIGGDEFDQISLIPTIELTDPMIAIAGAAALAASHDGIRRLDERIELLAAAVDGGCHFTTTIPLSSRRALAAASAARNDLDGALQHLHEAEQECRREQAVCELVEILILGSSVNAIAGRQDWAEANAIEADYLAERLGMLGAQRRARQLYRISQPGDDPHDGPLQAILMSDVVGSTLISHSQGDEAYYELVMEHHELVRRQLVHHDGTEFSEGGDSLFVWFNSLTEAMDCAFAIQAEAARQRRAGGDLSIRVAVAAGKPFFSAAEGRPYGSVVNRAARLSSQAEPDQIVVDEQTLQAVGPVIEGFATKAADLRGLGSQMIGILDLGPKGG